jgi:hypothetical protein
MGVEAQARLVEQKVSKRRNVDVQEHVHEVAQAIAAVVELRLDGSVGP